MLTPNETHELLKLHEKLDTLTKALQTIFFVTSYIRGYCIRKLFRSLNKEK